jgi:F0F1-type ATP synthase delta subunit
VNAGRDCWLAEYGRRKVEEKIEEKIEEKMKRRLGSKIGSKIGVTPSILGVEA